MFSGADLSALQTLSERVKAVRAGVDRFSDPLVKVFSDVKLVGRQMLVLFCLSFLLSD